MKNTPRALVIGAGIGGVRAALDLAQAGCRVLLADKRPVPGGLLLSLDRQFPDNHCGLCRILPRDLAGRVWQACMRRGLGHPGIEFLPGLEVLDIQGSPGNLSAEVIRREIKVDPEKCTACLECVQACPVYISRPDAPVNEPLKAIHPAAPHKPGNHLAIDLQACTLCGKCLTACPAGAIELVSGEEAAPLEKLDFAILASGVDYTLPQEYNLLGCAGFPDTVTSLEFERLISGAGPTGGELLRPSDGRPVRSAAWIQCVGSRNLNLDADHCSGICCMISLKQASLAREKGIDCAVFYMDLRTPGLEGRKYLDRAVNSGVELVRCRPHSITRDPENDRLCLSHAPSPGKIQDRDFDLVVLSVGRDPQYRLPEYASRQGVFTTPGSERVLDIPDSLVSASAVAAQALDMAGAKVIQDQTPPGVLVVGGGPAGLSAAHILAGQGVAVTLVEKGESLGGNSLAGTCPETGKHVQELADKVANHSLVQVYPGSRVLSCEGPAGGFTSRILDASGQEKSLGHAAAILATGGGPLESKDQVPGSMSVFQFSKRLFAPEPSLDKPGSVVFVLCHETRKEPVNYCSKVCCKLALQCCLRILELWPDTRVSVFYRDITVQGDDEKLYTRARSRGVRFIPYSPDTPPSMQAGDKSTRVSGWDPYLREEIQLEADELILASGVTPGSGQDMSRAFDIRDSDKGFLGQLDAKYQPMQSVRAGIFVCGLARSPVLATEALQEGRAAAMSALNLLAVLSRTGARAFVRVKPALCSLCRMCMQACPFQARYPDHEAGCMAVDPLACRGCGVCIAVCPNDATAWSEQAKEEIHHD